MKLQISQNIAVQTRVFWGKFNEQFRNFVVEKNSRQHFRTDAKGSIFKFCTFLVLISLIYDMVQSHATFMTQSAVLSFTCGLIFLICQFYNCNYSMISDGFPWLKYSGYLLNHFRLKFPEIKIFVLTYFSWMFHQVEKRLFNNILTQIYYILFINNL